MLTSVKSIVLSLGGAKSIAEELRFEGDDPGGTVRAWVNRDSIPPAWFVDLERLAIRLGVSGVTAATLSDFHKSKRRLRSAEAAN